MPISRRALLYGGAGFAASLGGGVATWKALARAAVASPTRGVVCTGNASSTVAPPPVAQLHLESLARFVDPLPVPPVARPVGTHSDPRDPTRTVPLYRASMRAAEVRLHRDLPPAHAWTYDGAMPGPTFETRSHEGLAIEWSNELPNQHFLPVDHTLHGAHADAPEVRAVVHVHGAKAPPESDGYPEDAITPGRSTVAVYPNEQDAATLWYHDHAMGLERLNQYAGLFGLFLVRDAAEDALGLPAGEREIPLVLCDRVLSTSGQLVYPTSGSATSPWIPELRGDALLVNGTLFPYLDVAPRGYRFRIVNAANARFYDLVLSSGRPFLQIGSDQGLLPRAVERKRLSLAPGERADVIVDFSASSGETVLLRTGAADMLAFRVARGQGEPMRALTTELRSITRFRDQDAAATRRLTLEEYQDPATKRMLMLLDGKYWREPVTERPRLGSVEVWSLMNLTEDIHPIHLHLVRFQVLDRQPFDADEYQTSGTVRSIGAALPPEPGETGWKDTVQVPPGTITRIAARFEGFAGKYVWHCHVLEHAANEMMRPFEVVA